MLSTSPHASTDTDTLAEGEGDYTYPEYLVAFAGQVFFTADDGVHGRELWKCDDSGSSVQMVKDIVPGQNQAGPQNLIVMGDSLYFAVLPDPSQGFTLWKTGGTEATTEPVQSGIPYGGAPWALRDFTVVDNRLFFFVDMLTTYPCVTELWVADGTSAHRVTEVPYESPYLEASRTYSDYWPDRLRPVAFNSTLFFVAGNGNSIDVWQSDGTAANTRIIKDLRDGTTSQPHSLTVVGDEFYFAEDFTGLWRSNGTAAGTLLASSTIHPNLVTSVNDTLYFTNTYDNSLWAVESGVVAQLAPDCFSPHIELPYLRAANSRLFFLRDGGRELWSTEGTPATTSLVREFAEYDQVVRLDSAGSLLLATVWQEATTSYAFYAYDGNGQVGCIGVPPFMYDNRDAQNWYLPDYAAAATTSFFTVYTPADELALWRTDGTIDGTYSVTIPYVVDEGTNLSVCGTNGDDNIVAAFDFDGNVTITLNAVMLGTFLGKTQVQFSGQSGMDHLTLSGTTITDVIDIQHKDSGQVYWTAPFQKLILFDTEHLTVDCGAGDDYVNDPGGNTTILGGSGDDIIIITATDAGGVTIDGQEGSDIYEIQLGGLEGAVIVAESGNCDDVDSVTITGTSGPDTVTVTGDAQQTAGETVVIAAPLEHLVVNVGGGDDRIVVTELVEPLSALTFAGGTGSDTFTVVDVGSAVASLTVDGGAGTGEDQLEIDGELPPDVQIEHVAPVLNPLVGSSSCVRGQPMTIAGSFTHPTASTWNATVDYGDGTGPSTLAMNPDGTFLLSHVYTASATSYTVSVQVTDDSGATASASFAISVRTAEVQLDSADALRSVLAVGGTTAADMIVIAPGAAAGQYSVRINSELFGDFSALPNTTLSRLLVFAQAGQDDVQVAGSVELAAWLYGGQGDDRLKGGAGHDVLLGGDGADLLVGNDGRDILIGGAGADRIVGNADDDILVAGNLVFANLDAALAAIRTEWISDRTYQERIENLTSEQDDGSLWEARANGDYFLFANSGDPDRDTVRDDGSSDVLTGSAGIDWFFFNEPEDLDRATDLKDEVFANVLDWITAL